MAKQIEWVKQSVASAPGFLDVTLDAALPGFIRFEDDTRVSPSAIVDYVINDGDNREIGVGSVDVATNTLRRLYVKAKISSGTYSQNPALGLNLTASAIVSCEAIANESQVDIVGNYARFWTPKGFGSTSVDSFGLNPTIVGTLTARSYANTSVATKRRRVGIESPASSGAIMSWLDECNCILTEPTAVAVGFKVVIENSVSDAGSGGNHRQFIGMTTSLSAPSSADPSTLTNIIGIGTGDSNSSGNLWLYYGGSTAQTPINLGASFFQASDMWDRIIIESPAHSPGEVYVTVFRPETNVITTKRLIAITPGDELPDYNTPMHLTAWRSNGGSSSLAVGLDLGQISVEAY
jgi:hypothetical protein